MVSCSTYESCFQSSTFGKINSCLNGNTHGPVHILIGGEWLDPEEGFIDKVGERRPPIVSRPSLSLRPRVVLWVEHGGA